MLIGVLIALVIGGFGYYALFGSQEISFSPKVQASADKEECPIYADPGKCEELFWTCQEIIEQKDEGCKDLLKTYQDLAESLIVFGGPADQYRKGSISRAEYEQAVEEVNDAFRAFVECERSYDDKYDACIDEVNFCLENTIECSAK